MYGFLYGFFQKSFGHPADQGKLEETDQDNVEGTDPERVKWVDQIRRRING